MKDVIYLSKVFAMKKVLIIGLVGTLFLIGWCLNKSTNSQSQNPVQNPAKTGQSTSLKVMSGQTTTSLSGWEKKETQTSSQSSSVSGGSEVSPEEEKLIEDILNSIFED